MSCLLVKNLNSQTSIQILEGCFFPYKPLKVLDLNKNEDGSKTARIQFESKENANRAMEEMNLKEIMNRKIKIEFFQQDVVIQDDEETKELIGEAVYPIALGRYGKVAPKLTGMLVESIIKNIKNDKDLLNALLSDDIILDELVDYAYDKFVLES